MAALEARGAAFVLEDGRIFIEPSPPSDVVANLKAVRPELLRVLEGRRAAGLALAAPAPPDAYETGWRLAQAGLKRFLTEGWGDRCIALGWTSDELFAVPKLWRQIHLTGAGLLLADKKVVAATSESIVAESLITGSRLRFRRRGFEHVA
jgi:hypothetical protein